MEVDMMLVYLNLLSSDHLYGYRFMDIGDVMDIGNVSEWIEWSEEIKKDRIEYWLKRLGVENEW